VFFSNAFHRVRPRSPHRHRDPRRPQTPNWHTGPLLLEALEDRMLPSCTLSIVPGEPAPQLVGERVLWTATPSDCGRDLVYQFRVAPPGGAFHVVRDFSPANTFAWTPMQEGTYDMLVAAKEGYQATEAVSTVVSDSVNSRITGRHAVITPTSNPLVALYSTPPCREGAIHVEFSVAGQHPDWQSTNTLPCEDGLSRNFLVAGILPDTPYELRHVITDHHHQRYSSPLLFTSGSLPADLTFPTFTVRQPPGQHSDRDHDMIYHVLPGPVGQEQNPAVLATDLMGRVVWYYDSRGAEPGLALRIGDTLLPGGTLLVQGRDQQSSQAQNVLREVDLAGNPLRETNLDVVNAQLQALGHDIIYGFSHDTIRLANGDTVLLGYTERTIDIGGTPTDYIGDMVVVLDPDFQVNWAWDAFDHLDVKRGPVLGEVCNPGDTGPECIVPRLPAVDWLLVNAVSLSPADGNLVLSGRYQDWVLKIDYSNGNGDGHVVWRLGQDGHFTVDSTDPDPWFSHQHNAHYVDDSTLVLFDNGNTRRTRDPNADSRGQVWRLDEQTMTATLVFNVDLGNYSLALGSAEQLSNGNFSFTSGRQGTPPNLFGQTIEVLPDGTQTYVLEVAHQEFRSYRIRSLYEGTNDFSANGGGGAPSGRQPPVAPQRQGLPPEVFGFSLGQEIATQRQATGTLHPPATAQLIEGFELARSQSGLEPSRLLGFPVLGHARRPYTGAGAAPRRMPAEGYWELLADLFADSNLLALTTEAI